jgi:hypothetical protein
MHAMQKNLRKPALFRAFLFTTPTPSRMIEIESEMALPKT